MKVRYRVHSVGPAERAVQVQLPNGASVPAVVKAQAAELVPEGEDHGTVKLLWWEGEPFRVGEVVEATFEVVEGAP